MKKVFVLFCVLSLLICGCLTNVSESQTQENTDLIFAEDKYVERFSNINDDNLLNYIEESIYSEISAELSTDEYIVENVDAVFYTKEYIVELAANSQKNIYFGYTVDQLNNIFKGKNTSLI